MAESLMCTDMMVGYLLWWLVATDVAAFICGTATVLSAPTPDVRDLGMICSLRRIMLFGFFSTIAWATIKQRLGKVLR